MVYNKDFFSIPSDPVRRKLWIDIISNYSQTDLVTQFDVKICSKHFSEDDYFHDGITRTRLKPTALPNMVNCKIVKEQLEEQVSELKKELHKAKQNNTRKSKKTCRYEELN